MLTHTLSRPSRCRTWCSQAALTRRPRGNPHRGIVNKKGATHYEPITPLLLQYNPLLAQFSAAWMKVHLDLTPQADGHDYAAMIYGNDKASLCGGGDGDQVTCTIRP